VVCRNGFVDSFAEVLPQMPAIDNLLGLRSGGAGRL
jgi:hypothetical protein